MRTKLQVLLHLSVVTAMLLAAIGIMPASASRLSAPAATVSTTSQAALSAASQPAQSPGPASVQSGSDDALAKLDTQLKQIAQKGGSDLIDVKILVNDRTKKDVKPDWQGIVQAVPLAQPDDATGFQVWYGKVQATNLAKLASLDFVAQVSYNGTGEVPRFRDPDQSTTVQVTQAERDRLTALRNNPPKAPAKPTAPTGWWDVGPGHESSAAWANGFTGTGVTVADIDSGVDFCNADLYGTWKTYNVASSRNITYSVYTEYPYQQVTVPNYYNYYNGWPEMLSPVSNLGLFFDLYINGSMTNINTFAYGQSKFADTRATGTGNTIMFDGKVYTTTGTASIFNPVYHIGYHPDTSLQYNWWGERIAVLLVDENGDGVYDTVYVDLNDDHDFSDDQPANKSHPAACWDADGDGKADLSGGLVYFIADGKHFPSMMDWWWNPTASFLPAPGAGELVAFMFDDPLGPAAAHGTLTAGNIVGQGAQDGNPAIYGGTPRPTWKPTGVGGMVQGGGKNAKLIAIGDSYQLFTASTEEAWYFAAMGLDGYGDTDDGAQITSNSFGESATDNDEWDNRSRLITRLNTRTSYRSFPATFNQQLAFMVSTGNGAPGYGTVTSANGSTVINVGASTQFGSTGDFDSISGSDQIVWGDVIPWSNRGPSAEGHLAPSITADGAFAAGDLTLNGSFGDGNAAWESWGGTSRSAPVSAGNMALIYDAWKQRTGSWPTWSQARDVMMNGATDQKNDVLTQGAGAVNANRSTEIANGLYGLRVTPSTWYPGSYQGTDYLSFAQIITPGGSDSQVFTARNYSPITITAPLTATYLTKIKTDEFTVTLDTANESPYAFTRPDYLWNVNQYAPGGIPTNTELMVAEVIEPFDEFASGNTALGNNWRILWYSAKDVNGNGRLWQDANSNGAVNDGEIDSGEYVRFAYGYNVNDYHQVSVKEPLTRWKDGIYLGLQHRNRTSDVPVSNLHFRVTYYTKSDWSWLSINAPDVTANPASNGVFTVTANVPGNAPYGIYEGAVEVNVPASGSYDAYTTIIPVVFNVAFSGDVTAAPITLGGTPPVNTRYDNGSVQGAQDWSWRPESGDWRFYFLDQATAPDVGTNLIVQDKWNDPAPETDIDTLLMSPSNEAYVSLHPPVNFGFGDFSTTDPATFGPYRLETTAGSVNENIGAGIWAFQTKTGGNTEYVATPLSSGLNEVVQHSVRYQGDKFEVPFTKTVSTLDMTSDQFGAFDSLEYTNYFDDGISIGSNITRTGGITVEVYGLGTTNYPFSGLQIHQDPTNGDYCDFANGGIYTQTITIGNNVSNLDVNLYVGSNDLDLFLLYNPSGNFSCPDDVIGSSTQSAGFDEHVGVAFPQAGQYMVLVEGWAVLPNPSTFSWDYNRTDLDNSIQIDNADLSVGPYKPATFDLSNTAGACSDVTASCNQGIMYIGLADAPRLISVPITVDYDGPNLSGSNKDVNADMAVAGDTLTYTIGLLNSSYVYTATNAHLTDTLPSEVTFGHMISGGATFSGGKVLWNGDVAPSIPDILTTTAYSWVNITNTGNVVSWPGGDDDEGVATVSLPWVFQYFGKTYKSVQIGANGVVGFGDLIAKWNGNGAIPNTADPNNDIMAMYGDQVGPSYDASADAVYYEDMGDGRFVVQFNNWEDYNTGDLNTYEVILHQDGSIEGQYQTVNSTPGLGASVTPADVGVENATGSQGSAWADTPASSTAWSYQSGASIHPILFTVTVNSGVPIDTLIDNTFDINNSLGNISTIGPAETIVDGADLSNSSKSVSAADAIPNQVMTYTVVISNSGPTAATAARMKDVLPTDVTFNGGLSGGATYSATIKAILWTGALNSDASHTVTFRVKVNAPLDDGTLIDNAAQVGDGLGTWWWTNTAETEVHAANVTLQKLANTSMAASGSVVTYTVLVHNIGAGDAAVVVNDTLPAGLTLLGATKVDGPGSVVSAGGVVTYTGSLDGAYASNATIRYTAMISGNFPQVITNTVTMNDGQGNVTQAFAAVSIAPVSQIYLPIVLK